MLFNVNYIIKIYIHYVIKRNEFFSRIDVNNDNVQNKTCNRY
jgi:hypothetical protein